MPGLCVCQHLTPSVATSLPAFAHLVRADVRGGVTGETIEVIRWRRRPIYAQGDRINATVWSLEPE